MARIGLGAEAQLDEAAVRASPMGPYCPPKSLESASGRRAPAAGPQPRQGAALSSNQLGMCH
eukprot:15457759-Alexandrium_andersonii.AAC.1